MILKKIKVIILLKGVQNVCQKKNTLYSVFKKHRSEKAEIKYEKN